MTNPLSKYLQPIFFESLSEALTEKGNEYRKCAMLPPEKYFSHCYQAPQDSRYGKLYRVRENVFTAFHIPYSKEIITFDEESFVRLYVHAELQGFTDLLIEAATAWYGDHPHSAFPFHSIYN